MLLIRRSIRILFQNILSFYWTTCSYYTQNNWDSICGIYDLTIRVFNKFKYICAKLKLPSKLFVSTNVSSHLIYVIWPTGRSKWKHVSHQSYANKYGLPSRNCGLQGMQLTKLFILCQSWSRLVVKQVHYFPIVNFL